MSKGELPQRYDFRDCVLSEHCTLTPTIKLVLLALDSFRSGQSPMPFPSQAKLAAITGYSDRAVRNALIAAASLGWISKTRRTRSNGSRTTDLYHLHVPPELIAARGSDSNILPAPSTGPTGTSFRGVPERGSPPESLYLNPSTESTLPSVKIDLRPFLDAYNASEGFIAPGRLGKALRPLLAAKAPHEALRAFTGWLKSPDVRFGPEYFVSHYAAYDLPPATDGDGNLNPTVLARLGIAL